jgi:hypothetical protein
MNGNPSAGILLLIFASILLTIGLSPKGLAALNLILGKGITGVDTTTETAKPVEKYTAPGATDLPSGNNYGYVGEKAAVYV